MSSQTVPSGFPLQGFESQTPPMHALGAEQAAPVVPQTHFPPTQRSALGALQGESHLPQWAALVVRSTQPVPQRVLPDGQPTSGVR